MNSYGLANALKKVKATLFASLIEIIYFYWWIQKKIQYLDNFTYSTIIILPVNLQYTAGNDPRAVGASRKWYSAKR